MVDTKKQKDLPYRILVQNTKKNGMCVCLSCTVHTEFVIKTNCYQGKFLDSGSKIIHIS